MPSQLHLEFPSAQHKKLFEIGKVVFDQAHNEPQTESQAVYRLYYAACWAHQKLQDTFSEELTQGLLFLWWRDYCDHPFGISRTVH